MIIHTDENLHLPKHMSLQTLKHPSVAWSTKILTSGAVIVQSVYKFEYNHASKTARTMTSTQPSSRYYISRRVQWEERKSRETQRLNWSRDTHSFHIPLEQAGDWTFFQVKADFLLPRSRTGGNSS